MVRVAIALLLLALLPSVASAEARFALLIGNQSYDPSVGVLKNPHNDIAVVGEALAKQGFELLPPVKDARRSAILGAVRDLVRRLNAGGSGAIGFIYYSGHGAAEKDTNINYLIPVDAKEPGTTAFWDESLKLDDVLRLLDGARSAAKFVVFDACRNELQLPSKDTSKGLVPVAEQQGMFIAYASAPGRTASDRGLKSGPYAAALAEELGKPGLDHLGLFQNVKETVYTASGGSQQPWESNGLVRRVYLTGQTRAPETAVATPPPPRASEAERTWPWVKDTTNQSVLENFIKQFGDTPSGAQARARLEELKRQQVAASATPSAPSPVRPTQPAVASPPAPKPAIAIPPAKQQVSAATPLNAEHFRRSTSIGGERISYAKQSSPEECRLSCQREPRCKAFDFGTDTQVCGLFSAVYRELPTSTHVTGYANPTRAEEPKQRVPVASSSSAKHVSYKHSTSINGQRISYSKQDTVEQCERSCLGAPNCNAFDFGSNNRTCGLFSVVYRELPTQAYTSGRLD